MSSTGRRSLFALEIVFSLIVLGLAIYLLVKAPLSSIYSYSYNIDFRYICPRYLLSISCWSVVFSIIYFSTNFALPSRDVDNKNRRIVRLIFTGLECCCWAFGAALAAYEVWDFKDSMDSVTWDILVGCTACVGIMILMTFVNFILACRDLHARNKAYRMRRHAKDVEGASSINSNSNSNSNTYAYPMPVSAIHY